MCRLDSQADSLIGGRPGLLCVTSGPSAVIGLSGGISVRTGTVTAIISSQLAIGIVYEDKPVCAGGVAGPGGAAAREPSNTAQFRGKQRGRLSRGAQLG